MKQPLTAKSLGSATDLTLIAEIKPGMLQEWEAVSHASRAVAIMRVVNGLRASREERQTSVYGDPIEKVELIHSFRVALTKDSPPRLLLSVTFDHHWEPYIRVVWRDLGPLLDPILCHCVGYPLAVTSSFETYEAWIRDVQLPTQWFYNASQLTVTDLGYLTQVEKLLRDEQWVEKANLQIARFAAETPEALLEKARKAQRLTREEMAQLPEADRSRLKPEARKQALGTLLAFHSLVRFYGQKVGVTPATGKPNDAALLLRLAKGIIVEADIDELSVADKQIHAQAVAWLKQPLPPMNRGGPSTTVLDRKTIQKGLLTGFDRADHGAVLLLQLVDAAKARTWLAGLPVSTEDEAAADSWMQVAFGWQGLVRLGLKEDLLKAFPQEFKEGAEVRAPQLGDQRAYHPRNWRLPERNWPLGASGLVKPDMMDVVIQLRARVPGAEAHEFDDGHPLFARIDALAAAAAANGLLLTAVVPMLSASAPTGQPYGRDHFGLMDGVSQPVPVDGTPVPSTAAKWSDETGLGEILLGRPNDRDSMVQVDDFRRDGSFLVIRRMAQHRDRFDDLVSRGEDQSNRWKSTVVEKLLGRSADGGPTRGAPLRNDFTFDGDPHGDGCPLQSHVRRANPRAPIGPRGERPVRLMRRGMSYGSRVRDDNRDEPRGLMFMAYCASIAEQYEVVQRWVNGGNSTRIGSFLTDPLMGVPRRGDTRTFRFVQNERVYRIDLNVDEKPAVELEWTGYFFVPSVTALRNLPALAPGATAQPADEVVAKGAALIARVRAAEASGHPAARQLWQTLFDDVGSRTEGVTAAVWAAIGAGPELAAPKPPFPRPDPALWQRGVLKCPYGSPPEDDEEGATKQRVMVGSRTLMDEALAADGNWLSVKGYDGRAKMSMGAIYLGLDVGTADYKAQSEGPNAAIWAIGFDAAFALAEATTAGVLRALFAPDPKLPVAAPVPALADLVLGSLCKAYFDVPDGNEIVQGGLDFRDLAERKPQCPGDYYSPSRYMFDPTPSERGIEMGKAHGAALVEATAALARGGRRWEGRISGPIAQGIFGGPVATDATPDDAVSLFARTHMGVMMGFLPTSWGSLIGIFDDWIGSGELWRLQSSLVAGLQPGEVSSAVLLAPAREMLLSPMKSAMQRRPAPDFIWRTAIRDEPLGGLLVKAGDQVALSTYAATLEAQAKGSDDVSAIFGGMRPSADAPSHACPGYNMAMGTLLGIVTALLARATMRPTSAQLTLELLPR